MNHWLNRCHFGDVRDMLRQMIADGVKVNTIVTSPPYWGLRSYLPDGHPDKAREIGSEPTLREFIETMTGVMMLAREVLADDGTMWMNMGDSYAGSRGGGAPSESSTLRGNGHIGGGPKIKSMTASRRRDNNPIPRSDVRVEGLKPKDLAGQPWRLAFALQDAGWWLRSDIIWAKPNPMPESTRDRPTKAHEYLFLMAKSERYYFDFEAWKEPVTGGAHARRPSNGVGFGHGYDDEPKPRQTYKTPDGWDTSKGEGGHGAFHKEGREKGYVNPKAAQATHATGDAYADGKSERMGRGPGWRERKLAEAGSGTKNNTSFDEAMAVMPDDRNRRTVWTVNTEAYKGAHFATFPRALIEPCILAGAPVGGVVLDIFMGSGTTAQVAEKLGRQWIGIDIDIRNKALQDERLRQPSLTLEAV